MTVETWESLPVEVRKYLVQKRIENSDRTQGTATFEKYGVYMKNWYHKDPSDHVIIAHAITEHLPLISEDGKFEFYKKQGLDLILNKK